MKVLIVCSANSGKIAPFIEEQVASLQALGIEMDYFFIQQKGIVGYLKLRKPLIQKIKDYKPDLIHAHYGLSGLLANLQRIVPVVTTYHGSDINNSTVFIFSFFSIVLSSHNIFVSEKNRKKSFLPYKNSLIPCGVNTQLFKPTEKNQSRLELGLEVETKLVLFSGAFNNVVKNSKLAISAVSLLPEVQLIEMKGYSRKQVALFMNAVDVALMTSHSEGSPQFIKEVMACNCPIVSVDVGDVADMIRGIDGCYIAHYDATDIADKLNLAISFGKQTTGRKRIEELRLDSVLVAERIVDIYNRTGKH
jgi:teichuronic acid biosynthesis glycosyltransferase TuaC